MSALDDYTVKRSETRRAEIVELAGAILAGLLSAEDRDRQHPRAAAEYANTAVTIAIATQKRIDDAEGDTF